MTANTLPRTTEVATVASMIRQRANDTPDAVALRQKSLGIWQEITWSEYWNKIEDVAYGLIALGVEPGDRVAIQSENRPRVDRCRRSMFGDSRHLHGFVPDQSRQQRSSTSWPTAHPRS